jgi:hypothetical protein
MAGNFILITNLRAFYALATLDSPDTSDGSFTRNEFTGTFTTSGYTHSRNIATGKLQGGAGCIS